MSIKYLIGDATNPPVPGNKIIAHVCNDVGGWGRGFVLSLSRRWPDPEACYRAWYRSRNDKDNLDFPPFTLGRVIFVPVNAETHMANMIAQHDVRPKEDGTPPIRYGALEECLQRLAKYAQEHVASVHMPRIGCGLAGGKWSEIEPILQRCFVDTDVYVYDFDTGDHRTVPWKK